MMSMHMFFHDQTDFYMLFEDWMVMNEEELTGACFAIFFVSIIMEATKGIY
jgi:hypothetical protein